MLSVLLMSYPLINMFIEFLMGEWKRKKRHILFLSFSFIPHSLIQLTVTLDWSLLSSQFTYFRLSGKNKNRQNYMGSLFPAIVFKGHITQWLNQRKGRRRKEGRLKEWGKKNLRKTLLSLRGEFFINSSQKKIDSIMKSRKGRSGKIFSSFVVGFISSLTRLASFSPLVVIPNNQPSLRLCQWQTPCADLVLLWHAYLRLPWFRWTALESRERANQSPFLSFSWSSAGIFISFRQ